jgi:type IV secretory pathway VirB2 component (pilin)
MRRGAQADSGQFATLLRAITPGGNASQSENWALSPQTRRRSAFGLASAAIESDQSIMAQAAITNDPGQSVFVAASGWVEGLLLGSFSNAVAVLAVALLGYGMLSGRTDLRRSGRVLLGCFILFGASLIARGLMDFAGLGGGVVTIDAASADPGPEAPRPKLPPRERSLCWGFGADCQLSAHSPELGRSGRQQGRGVEVDRAEELGV